MKAAKGVPVGCAAGVSFVLAAAADWAGSFVAGVAVPVPGAAVPALAAAFLEGCSYS